jgi:hypothetical protein
MEEVLWMPGMNEEVVGSEFKGTIVPGWLINLD